MVSAPGLRDKQHCCRRQSDLPSPWPWGCREEMFAGLPSGRCKLPGILQRWGDQYGHERRGMEGWYISALLVARPLNCGFTDTPRTALGPPEGWGIHRVARTHG